MAKKNKHHITDTSSDSLLSGLYSPQRRALILQPPETLTIGYRLRRERYLRKWTLDQMSAYLGISISYLGALERGDRAVSAKMMRKLHRKLNLSYDFLLEGISLTGEAISQYVRESSDYSVQHNLDVLLGVCSDDELENCYELVHTYLTTHRQRIYEPKSPAPKPPRKSAAPKKYAAAADKPDGAEASDHSSKNNSTKR